MAIKKQFKPVLDAIIDSLNIKDPDEVVFIVGRKEYRTRELLVHFKKEDNIAETIIHYTLRVACQCDDTRTMSLSQDQIEAAVKLFKM
jgi:hypothetical protein